MKGEDLKNTRNLVIDAGRGISILYIVGFHHLRDYIPSLCKFVPLQANRALVCGELAFFFFVSGWLLAQKNFLFSMSDVGAFYRRRFFRIIPLYALAIAALPFHVPLGIRVLSLVGINNFLPGIDGRNIPTLWFASQMIFFYALFPPLSIQKYQQAKILIMIVVETILYSGATLLGWDHRLWWYFPCFAVGMQLSGYDVRVLVKAAIPACAIFLVALCSQFWLYPVLTAISGAATVLVLAFVLSKVQILAPFWLWVARASFAAYLFHRTLFNALISVLPSNGNMRVLCALFTMVPLVFAVSYGIQIGYDHLLSKLNMRKQ